jgi:hypothetical protein
MSESLPRRGEESLFKSVRVDIIFQILTFLEHKDVEFLVRGGFLHSESQFDLLEQYCQYNINRIFAHCGIAPDLRTAVQDATSAAAVAPTTASSSSSSSSGGSGGSSSTCRPLINLSRYLSDPSLATRRANISTIRCMTVTGWSSVDRESEAPSLILHESPCYPAIENFLFRTPDIASAVPDDVLEIIGHHIQRSCGCLGDAPCYWSSAPSAKYDPLTLTPTLT